MSLLSILIDPGSIWRKLVSVPLIKRGLKYCGKNVFFGKNVIIEGSKNISIGDHSCVGPNCVFYATLAPLTIGKYVLVSPNVTIMTGEHRTDIVGEYIRNVTEDMKKPDNDKAVIIEDDVWIGSNVTILKGVTIGRGSIIHAGSVVSRKVKPYTIYISDQMKVTRFTDDQIQEHERNLKEKYGVEYPEYHPKSDKLFG